MPKLLFYNGLHSRLVGTAGLEPATLCLEGRCSIQLSYGYHPAYCAGESDKICSP